MFSSVYGGWVLEPERACYATRLIGKKEGKQKCPNRGNECWPNRGLKDFENASHSWWHTRIPLELLAVGTLGTRITVGDGNNGNWRSPLRCFVRRPFCELSKTSFHLLLTAPLLCKVIDVRFGPISRQGRCFCREAAQKLIFVKNTIGLTRPGLARPDNPLPTLEMAN